MSRRRSRRPGSADSTSCSEPDRSPRTGPPPKHSCHRGIAVSMSKLVAVGTIVTGPASSIALNVRHHPSRPALTEGPDVISSTIAEIGAELIDFRRDIHAHPELSFQEFETTDKIVARLEAAGLQPRRLEGTGVVCEVGDGPLALVLRADIDALPVDDLIDEDFRSTVPGVAH